MPNINLPALFDLLPDPSLFFLFAGGIASAFTLCVLFVVPPAVFGKGETGRNARVVLELLLGLFYALLDTVRRGGQR